MRYLTSQELANDRQEVALWARDLLKEDFLILDTETTGLGKAEVCELTIINQDGRTVLSTLIKPTVSIPLVVTAIHRLDDAAVDQAPSFAEVSPLLNRWVKGAKLCIYNYTFDMGILQHCATVHSVPAIEPKQVHCVMRQYSKFMGDWNPSRGSYKWQKLPGGDHTALGDCLATLKLIHEMAEACHQPSPAADEGVERFLKRGLTTGYGSSQDDLVEF